MTTTTDDAPSAVRATAPAWLTTAAVWFIAIGGALYLTVSLVLGAAGEEPVPLWAHTGVLTALVVGAIVSCTVVIRQAIARGVDAMERGQRAEAAARKADIEQVGNEIAETYTVLARRLRDHGQQVAQTRESVASIRGFEHAESRESIATRVALASAIAEFRALREAVGQLVKVMPEVRDEGFRKGLVAAAQQDADVLSIVDRAGSPNGRFTRS